MLADQLTPNKKRPLSSVFVGARPGSDARWRGVPRRERLINRLDVLELQEQQRAQAGIKK